MSDIENDVIDSLKRQIAETKKQIKQVSAKNRNKDLELRRKSDQIKARLVLSILRCQKQVKELEEIHEEHSRQWSLDFHSFQSLIMVIHN
jgi:hypothetical protein